MYIYSYIWYILVLGNEAEIVCTYLLRLWIFVVVWRYYTFIVKIVVNIFRRIGFGRFVFMFINIYVVAVETCAQTRIWFLFCCSNAFKSERTEIKNIHD